MGLWYEVGSSKWAKSWFDKEDLILQERTSPKVLPIRSLLPPSSARKGALRSWDCRAPSTPAFCVAEAEPRRASGRAPESFLLWNHCRLEH